MRRMILIAACALVAAALPAIAGAGAVKFEDSWTNEPQNWYMGEFACTGKPPAVAGTALMSGSVRATETPGPGAHVQLSIEGSVALYEAAGPPWDPQLGAYVGTWTYTAHQVENYNPSEQAVLSGVSHGQIVFADGNTAMLKIGFTLIFEADGSPKLFFAKAACGGE